jgi:glycosyltransferase involved in cell wall biosynthesis
MTTTADNPLVTVIVPMRNEEAHIADCLASLRAQTYPALEILVLDGASTDRSVEIVSAIAETDPRVRLVDNPGLRQAAAMNAGLREAAGVYIVRADAHARYGPGYVAGCVAPLRASKAENVGGCQRAEGHTPFTRALAVAMHSPLAAGNAAYRLARTPQYTDTVWLGAWARTTLEELGGFDESLPANEDYELNVRLRLGGGRVLLDPTLDSTYYPRGTLGSLWRQYHTYGRAKARVLRLHPGSLVPRQLAPPLFVLLLLACLALLPLTWLPLAAIGVPYAAVVLLAAVGGARHAGFAVFPRLLLIYPTIHLAWGLGVLRGMVAGT